MRFMIIVKATKDSEAGVMPSEQLLTEMGKFNEELVNAGVMLAGEGKTSERSSRLNSEGKKNGCGRRRPKRNRDVPFVRSTQDRSSTAWPVRKR